MSRLGAYIAVGQRLFGGAEGRELPQALKPRHLILRPHEFGPAATREGVTPKDQDAMA